MLTIILIGIIVLICVSAPVWFKYTVNENDRKNLKYF